MILWFLMYTCFQTPQAELHCSTLNPGCWSVGMRPWAVCRARDDWDRLSMSALPWESQVQIQPKWYEVQKNPPIINWQQKNAFIIKKEIQNYGLILQRVSQTVMEIWTLKPSAGYFFLNSFVLFIYPYSYHAVGPIFCWCYFLGEDTISVLK